MDPGGFMTTGTEDLRPPFCLTFAFQLVHNSTGLLKILLKPGAWKGSWRGH